MCRIADHREQLLVPPGVFLHNDDRISALITVVGIALLIFGLIEADLRRALGPGTPLAGILLEGRAAIPTARAVLTAFADLHATYTPTGLRLDRLTGTQRLILAHLDIPLPWPETNQTGSACVSPATVGVPHSVRPSDAISDRRRSGLAQSDIPTV